MCLINILCLHYKLLGILTMLAINAPCISQEHIYMDVEVIFDGNE